MMAKLNLVEFIAATAGADVISIQESKVTSAACRDALDTNRSGAVKIILWDCRFW